MYFWFSIASLAILGVWALPATQAQAWKSEDVGNILIKASKLQEQLLEKLENGFSNTNCLVQGVKNRNIDILQLKMLADSLQNETGTGCNTIHQEWKNDFQELFQTNSLQLQSYQNKIITTTCGKFPTAVIHAIQSGQQAVTKKIILGLLSTVQPRIVTPDAITVLETAAEIVDKLEIPDFYLERGTDNVLEDIATHIMTENSLKPAENYQLTLISTAHASIQLNQNFHIFSLIKPNVFPSDVVNASYAIASAIADGRLEGCSENGWSTRPDQLLGLTTSLSALPNDHPLAAYVHVLFSHVRMWYLCQNGYQFVPRTFNDIVFLLNSFLTIRNPTLLREIYHEFSRIPWQDFTTRIDFSQYCDPRSLMIDIVQSILDNPNSLKTCNTILFNYFVNADEDCPHWLKPIFPINSTQTPLEVQVPEKAPPTTPAPTTTETPFFPISIECNEEDVKIVKPESLMEIFDSVKHPIIAEILLENPYPAEAVFYNTREGVLKQIFSDLIKTRTDYTANQQNAMVFAERGLQLNEKKLLPIEYECTLRKVTGRHVVVHLKCLDGEVRAIDPESLIEIFDDSHYPLLVQYLRDVTFTDVPDSSNRYSALLAVIKSALKDNISIELKTILSLFLSKTPPINRKGRWAVTWTCRCEPEPKCNLVNVINQESLIAIIDEKKITPIKNVVYLEPVFLKNYHSLKSRADVLKQVLHDRKLKLNDELLNLVLPQAIGRAKISWQGKLPPIIDEVCEHDLKYNITFEPDISMEPEDPPPIRPCDNVTVIDQKSLIEVITDQKINVIKNLIFMEPIIYADYKDLATREEILKKVLQDRMIEVNDEILNLVIPTALTRMQVSWKGMLPPVIDDVCKSDLVYNIVTPVPPLDDEIVCEEDAVEGPEDCGQNEISTLIVQTHSLFPALDDTAPRATVIRQKISSYVYPIYSKKVHFKSFVLRDILLSLRDEISDARLTFEIDQLLVSIRYDGNGMEPVDTKYVCLKKNIECIDGEKVTSVIYVKSLLEAFRPDTTIPSSIKDRLLTYIVPVDSTKLFKKGDVLKEILEDLLKDAVDFEGRQNILELIKAVPEDGAAAEAAEIVLACCPENGIPSGDDQVTEDCDSEELDGKETQVFPIRDQVLETTTTEIPVDCEESEEISTTTTTTEAPVECEEPEEITTTTTTTTEAPVECEESEEITTTTTTTEVPVDCEESEEITTTTTTTEEPLVQPVECDEPEEETPYEIIDCEEPEEVTTTTETIPAAYDCEEIEERTTTTTEAPTTTAAPKNGKPCLTDQWPLLLKVNHQERCFDETAMAQTHPVDVVSVGELLQNAEGNTDDKYIVSAKLAGLDTYQSMESFDWDAYCTKGTFFTALMKHIGFETNLIQRSEEEVVIRTVCRAQLYNAVPRVRRDKRHIIHENDAAGFNVMESAMTTAKLFL